MTKKDYELIARVLKHWTRDESGTKLVEDFCEELKRDNPRFNADMFRKAVYA